MQNSLLLTGQNTVDHHLDEFKISGGCGHIIWHTDVSACECDTRAVGVVFIRAVFTHDPRVTDVRQFVTGNVILANDAEGAGSFHALLGGSCGSLPYALT